MGIRLITKILFLQLIFLYSSALGQAESNIPAAEIKAIKIDKPLEITGDLTNPIWLTAEPIELNYEVTPGDNTPAAQKTFVRVLYDDKYIYFSFQC